MLRTAVACGLNLDDVTKDVKHHFPGGLVGIDPVYEMLSVEAQQRLRFLFVSLESISDHFKADVIQAVFLERAPLDAVDEIVDIHAAQIKDCHHIQGIPQHLSLACIARDAVQNERVLLGSEPSGSSVGFDRLPPKPDRRLIGHKLTPARIVDKGSPDRAVDGQISKHIATGAMKEIGDRSQNFSLRAFARAGRPEQ